MPSDYSPSFIFQCILLPIWSLLGAYFALTLLMLNQLSEAGMGMYLRDVYPICSCTDCIHLHYTSFRLFDWYRYFRCIWCMCSRLWIYLLILLENTPQTKRCLIHSGRITNLYSRILHGMYHWHCIGNHQWIGIQKWYYDVYHLLIGSVDCVDYSSAIGDNYHVPLSTMEHTKSH